MNRKSYEVNPSPDRDKEPLFYREGNNSKKAIEFLEKLSRDSTLQVSNPLREGIETYSACYTGKEVSEGLIPEEGEGYLVAIYDWADTEDITVLPESEIYIAFSEELPSEVHEPELGTGAVIEGSDEGTSTQQLVSLAEECLE